MTIRVEFWGAAGEVTGSCYVVSTPSARILIDLGMHQGEREADEHNQRVPPDVASLNAVILTHAHIDHCGRLPLLPGLNYRGPVYCTPATRDLCEVLLLDSARLQETDAARQTLRNAQRHQPAVSPLYTIEAVPPTLALFRTVPYGLAQTVAPGITARFVDSGHMLGSASVELTIDLPSGPPKRLVFSGDVGPRGMPLLNDPTIPGATGEPPDALIVESTYGDRDHRGLDATIAELRAIVHDASWSKEKILVPAFAVGRAQLAIYYLGRLALLNTTPRFPVYLDSPMAITAMNLYHRHASELDASMNAPADHGRTALDFPELHLCESADDSRAINTMNGPLAVIAGSGMCNGGRILHHLRHNLWKRDTRVIIIGYQAERTLGRQLVTGAQEVRIFGEQIPVRAKIHTVGGLSAHAGQSELLAWTLAARRRGQGKVILTHGEDGPRRALAAKIEQATGSPASMPVFRDVIEV